MSTLAGPEDVAPQHAADDTPLSLEALALRHYGPLVAYVAPCAAHLARRSAATKEGARMPPRDRSLSAGRMGSTYREAMLAPWRRSGILLSEAVPALRSCMARGEAVYPYYSGTEPVSGIPGSTVGIAAWNATVPDGGYTGRVVRARSHAGAAFPTREHVPGGWRGRVEARWTMLLRDELGLEKLEKGAWEPIWEDALGTCLYSYSQSLQTDERHHAAGQWLHHPEYGHTRRVFPDSCTYTSVQTPFRCVRRTSRGDRLVRFLSRRKL